MKEKGRKEIIILLIITLILVITAIFLRLSDSAEVPISTEEDPGNTGAGKVGVTIIPPNVEDKLAENSGEGST